MAFDAGEDPLEQHAVTVEEQAWEETKEEREAQEDPHHLYHSVGLVQDINPPEDVKVIYKRRTIPPPHASDT